MTVKCLCALAFSLMVGSLGISAQAPPAAGQVDYQAIVALVRATGETETLGAAIVLSQSRTQVQLITAAHVVQSTGGGLEVAFRNQPGKWYPANRSPGQLSPRNGGVDAALLTVTAAVPAIASAAQLAVLPTVNVDLEGHRARLLWRAAGPLPRFQEIVEATPDRITVAADDIAEGASGGAVITEHGTLAGMIVEDEPGRAGILPLAKLMTTLKGWGIAPQWTPNPAAAGSLAFKRLTDKGVIDSESLAEAIAKNDAELLNDFGAAGSLVRTAVIERALRSRIEQFNNRPAAALYFNVTRTQPNASHEWLKQAIAAGLDPNFRVPGNYYEEESLLSTALRLRNDKAAIALLESGASPHGYQDLYGTRYEGALFVTPLLTLLNDTNPNRDRRDDEPDEPERDIRPLIQSLRRAGLVVPDLSMLGPGAFNSVVGMAWIIDNQYKERFKENLTPTPTIGQSARDPICEAATKRTGFDWCAFTRQVPRLTAGTELRYLLHISRDTAYFLAMSPPVAAAATGRAPADEHDYVIVEVPRQGNGRRVYHYEFQDSPLPYCKLDADGTRPWGCWNRTNTPGQAAAPAR